MLVDGDLSSLGLRMNAQCGLACVSLAATEQLRHLAHGLDAVNVAKRPQCWGEIESLSEHELRTHGFVDIARHPDKHHVLALVDADLRRRFRSDIFAVDINAGACRFALHHQSRQKLREMDHGCGPVAARHIQSARIGNVARPADRDRMLSGLNVRHRKRRNPAGIALAIHLNLGALWSGINRQLPKNDRGRRGSFFLCIARFRGRSTLFHRSHRFWSFIWLLGNRSGRFLSLRHRLRRNWLAGRRCGSFGRRHRTARCPGIVIAAQIVNVNRHADTDCHNQGSGSGKRIQHQLRRYALDLLDGLFCDLTRLNLRLFIDIGTTLKHGGRRRGLQWTQICWRWWRGRWRSIALLERWQFGDFGEARARTSPRPAFRHHRIYGDLWPIIFHLRLERFNLGLIEHRGRHILGGTFRRFDRRLRRGFHGVARKVDLLHFSRMDRGVAAGTNSSSRGSRLRNSHLRH